jgi:hypothetical protein
MSEPSPVKLWLGLAFAIFGIVYALRRAPGVCHVWAAIPDDLKSFAPAAVAVLLAGIEAIASGRSVRQALAIAASAALTAQLAHHGLRFSPLPYGGTPKPEVMLDPRDVEPYINEREAIPPKPPPPPPRAPQPPPDEVA